MAPDDGANGDHSWFYTAIRWRQWCYVQFYLTLLPKFSLEFNCVQYQLILLCITWDKEMYLFAICPLAFNYEFQAIDHLTNESKNCADIILLTCTFIVPLPINVSCDA
jgi:hypothetical protein